MTAATRTWALYQDLVDAECEKRRKRAFCFSAVLGVGIGGVIGPSLVLGEWLLALIAAAVFVIWNVYRLTDIAILRGFNADRRRAARKAGVCPLCLRPGSRHWTLAGCSKEAEDA